MGFAAILTRLRLVRGLSQEELADASGVAVRTIRNLERGASRPRRATVRALAAGLRLSAAQREHLESAIDDADGSGGTAGTVPAPANRLIGRQAELRALARLVRGGADRVVTVVGPGGVGKSRLALQVAWHVAGTFERVDVIDLGPLRSRDEVLGALAAAAGAGTVATTAAIAERIGGQSWLLVLDSVEHVPGLGPDLAVLLDRCPRLRLLMTGRAAPSPAGAVFALEPLPVPETEATHPAAALANPAVELLVERARALQPAFALDESTMEAAVTICRRLDGLPLAIELAAGQLGERDVVRVAAELTVRTLQTPFVDVPERHRTLGATVEWSVALLGEVDRLVFGALGAFRGRVSVDALAAVLRAVPALTAASAPLGSTDLVTGPLARLAAVSLLRLGRADGTVVVDLLDTIRETARDRLLESGLADTCAHAHAEHLLAVLRSGDLAEADRQLDDIRAAVDFAGARAANLLDRESVSALADLLTAKGRFAETHRRLAEVAAVAIEPDVAGAAWLRAGIAANQHGDHRAALVCGGAAARAADALSAPARNLIGCAHKSLGELDLADTAFRACLAEAEARGEGRYVTVALNNLGAVAHDRGDLEMARHHYQRSLDIKTRLGDERGIAVGLLNLGAIDHERGQPQAAVALLTDALPRLRAIGEPHAVVFALVTLAGAHLALRELAAASECVAEATRMAGGIDNGPVRALACLAAGDLARVNGDLDIAEQQYADGLGHGPEPPDRARLLDRLAVVVRDSSPQRAVSLAAEAAGIRQRYGYAVLPTDRPSNIAAGPAA